MSFPVSIIVHVLLTMQKNVVLDMKITISGLIVEMFQLLDENLWYEQFLNNNVFLISCRERLVKVFVFDS